MVHALLLLFNTTMQKTLFLRNIWRYMLRIYMLRMLSDVVEARRG